MGRRALRLQDRVALVTGAGRGIGFHTAAELHRRGARVALVDVDGDAAARAAATLGPRAIGLPADVTDRGAMDEAAARTARTFGGIDVVVANAGIAPRLNAVLSTDQTTFDRVIEVNLLGAHRTVAATLPEVLARRGHVVVVSSVYAFMNGVLVAPYASSKAAVEQFGRALRAELAPHGATAGVVYFGPVDTAMVRDGLDDQVGVRAEGALPRALVRRSSPQAAARAVAAGIERRAARVIAPRRWTGLWMLRGIVNPGLDRWLERNSEIRAIVVEAGREGTR